jgi:hypothetical protein
MSDLTWNRAKDALLIGLIALFVSIFGYLAFKQDRIYENVALMREDMATIKARDAFNAIDHQEMKSRIAALETRRNN